MDGDGAQGLTEERVRRECSIEGCSRRHYGRGWCSLHYYRITRLGYVADPPKRQGFPDRLRAVAPGAPASEEALRVVLADKTDPNGDCWDWTGGVSSDGYGMAGRNKRVTRLVLEAVLGHSLTRAQVARHTCHRPICVRPTHLIVGTQAQNAADSVAAGLIASGERHYMSRLTDTQVAEVRAAYAAGGITQRELAERYGVTQTAVSAIVRNKNRRAKVAAA